jgi:hypothetical protein
MASGCSVLKMCLGALGISRAFFCPREGVPAGFCVVFGVRGSGRGRLGDKTKMRHFSGILGCVGNEHP